MKLLEYEAKNILRHYSVPIPRGEVSSATTQTIKPPCVLKSQVPVGGRGKAGGILILSENDPYGEAVNRLLNLPIQGYTPRTIWCEELLDITKEYYLSLVINRSEEAIELVAHDHGGMEVEAYSSNDLFRRTIIPASIDGIGDALADYLDITGKSFLIQDLLENLLRCFIETDATLLEINPLCLTGDGRIVAGDCKMTLDDAALFRHPDWQFEDSPANRNFVVLDEQGTIASMANGAGLAMATVDAITAKGLKPANFLDIGGTATPETILKSFRQIISLPNINAIVINIFGGIVRCDDVAQAILEAQSRLTDLPRLVIRLSGNRAEEAEALLAVSGLKLHPTLASCLEELAS